MATSLANDGAPLWWKLTRDDETGHRDYRIRFRVNAATGQGVADGPYNVLNTPGLPLVGSLWNFDGDFDPWAVCHPGAEVTKEPDDDKPCRTYLVEQSFSTRPLRRCWDLHIENPLLEPQRVSGSFVDFTREATHDRFGRQVKFSSHEAIRGALNEWDESRPLVRIEQNVVDLQLGLITAMNNTVNVLPLWGMPRRTIKLTVLPWEQKYAGACFRYYTRAFEFRLSFERDTLGRPMGWDRVLLDEGTKVLSGRWEDDGTWSDVPFPGYSGAANPDPDNPAHFIRAFDRQGNVMRVVLDGNGRPYVPDPFPAITTCSECPSGAPTAWYLHVSLGDLTETPVNPYAPVGNTDPSLLNPYAPFNVYQLTNAGGCVWSGSGWTLTLAPGSVSLASPDGGLYVQTAEFACMGDNVMILYDGDGPQTVTLRPRLPTDSRPGEVRVERYFESNFLMLGVPIIL